MADSLTVRGSLILTGGFSLLLSVAIVALFGISVHAQAHRPSDSWQNGAERYVQSGGVHNPDGRYKGPTCSEGGWNIGTIWVTNENGTSEDVKVTQGQTSVNIRIYSTVRACSWGYAKDALTSSALAHITQCGSDPTISFTQQSSARTLFSASNEEGSAGSWASTRLYIANRDRLAGRYWSTNFQNNNYIKARLVVNSRGTGNYTTCIRASFSSPSCGYGRPSHGGAWHWCGRADRSIGYRIVRTSFNLDPKTYISSSTASDWNSKSWGRPVVILR